MYGAQFFTSQYIFSTKREQSQEEKAENKTYRKVAGVAHTHYNPSVKIALLTPFMLCVLIRQISCVTYGLKTILFKKFSITVLYTLRIFVRNLLRGRRQRNIFRDFVLFDLGFE